MIAIVFVISQQPQQSYYPCVTYDYPCVTISLWLDEELCVSISTVCTVRAEQLSWIGEFVVVLELSSLVSQYTKLVQ